MNIFIIDLLYLYGLCLHPTTYPVTAYPVHVQPSWGSLVPSRLPGDLPGSVLSTYPVILWSPPATYPVIAPVTSAPSDLPGDSVTSACPSDLPGDSPSDYCPQRPTR